VENRLDCYHALGEFIMLNTSVSEISGILEKDFSKELKFNNQLLYLQDNQPMSIYYLERNRNLERIQFHFKNKKIKELKMFDIYFKVQ
jgi:hypothetical protein